MNDTRKVVVTQMAPREKREWTPVTYKRRISKRLLRNTGIFAAVSLCVGSGAYLMHHHSSQVQSVMSHLTAGFEYDDSLGRLQFVSSILPESAMVFLNEDELVFTAPVFAEQSHSWSSAEPWIEYTSIGDVVSCQDGDVSDIIKNRQGEYTVCISHENGYQSVYSGLSSVCLSEFDQVKAGEQIGTSAGFAAFELRKENLSVMPVFSKFNQ